MLIAILKKVISTFFEYDLLAEEKANTTFFAQPIAQKRTSSSPFH